MSALKVTPEQLQTLGGACGRTASDVRGSHGTLRSQLTPILGSDWSGAASTRFQELFAQFDSSARSLSEALEGIGHLLGSAGRSYADVEIAIAGSFAT